MALEGRRVLFVSYNGMLDPLGQSQVIPYLRQLATRGINFTLLSFERAAAFTREGVLKCDQLRQQLAQDNIEWHWQRYHQKPSLPATGYDVISGIRYASQLVRKNGIEMVHARSHIAATIALALKKRFHVKMIFDVRGLMADEYVDAGHWRQSSSAYRLTKSMERRAFTASDGIVTLTEKIWPIIKKWNGLSGREVIHEVVPCCADLQLFRFSGEDRHRRRAQLSIQDRFTIVYSGSIDGWYLTAEMADFFGVLTRIRSDAHCLWLSPGKHERIDALMKERKIESHRYTILAATSADVPSYLSASDAGLAFIKPCFSKIASSPTKNAEYLACGLPLIINAGIGDSDGLVSDERVGAFVNELKESDYARALLAIERLTADPEAIRIRTREVAERLFDVAVTGVERYARLYEGVLASTS